MLRKALQVPEDIPEDLKVRKHHLNVFLCSGAERREQQHGCAAPADSLTSTGQFSSPYDLETDDNFCRSSSGAACTKISPSAPPSMLQQTLCPN